MNKRQNGQFFTTTNPFVNEAFVDWLENVNRTVIPLPTLIEPFAGSNNIVWMIRELDFDNPWAAYDIQPPDENSAEDVEVQIRDTINDFPAGYKVAITNPPYLAKNSAANRGLVYGGGEYEDLYQKALAVMLKNVDYVAAIIPETFIKQNLFHDRLHAVISLNCEMFEDTAHPVCLALFVPVADKTEKDNFEIWRGDQAVGSYKKLESFLKTPTQQMDWKFNDPLGTVGLKAADSAKAADIEFVMGSTIPSSSIKHSSRHNTRISLLDITDTEVESLIKIANKLLKARRKATKDVFMTAHRGLRIDGQYRRRLDFSQARDLLDLAYTQMKVTSKVVP